MTYYGSTEIGRMFHGATEIGEAWMHDGSMWRKIFTAAGPGRMNLDAQRTITAQATTKLTGWSPDAGYPATSIVDNELIVTKAGPITVTYYCVIAVRASLSDTVLLYRNGVQVASVTVSGNDTRTVTWSGTVAVGDRFAAYYRCASTFSSSIVGVGTYLKYEVS